MRQKTVITSYCNVWSGITKCGRSLLQSASGITKCDRLLLQSASGIAKCDSHYKVGRNTVIMISGKRLKYYKKEK